MKPPATRFENFVLCTFTAIIACSFRVQRIEVAKLMPKSRIQA
jgi:hypothetical protein